MKKMKFIILAILSLAVFTGKNITIKANNANILKILATSDIHNHFQGYQYATDSEYKNGGFTRAANYIKQQRSMYTNVVTIDNGDSIEGNSSSIFTQDQIVPMVEGFNQANYDFAVAGNHEFNYGMNFLKNMINQFTGEMLIANVYNPDGSRVAKNYGIVERNGIKIAVIGAVTPHITKWDAFNLKDYTVTSPFDEVRTAINQIKNGTTNDASDDLADVIILSFHGGVNGEYGEDSGLALANEFPELSAVITGHSHAVENLVSIHGSPIVAPGKFGEYISDIEFELQLNAQTNRYEIVNKTVQNIQLSNYSEDAEMLNSLAPYHQRALANARTVIGSLEGGPLVPEASIKGITQAQVQDTPLIDLINQVQLEKIKPLINEQNPKIVTSSALLDSNANVQAGPITLANVANIYKYDNTLMGLKVTPSQLKKYMEWSVEYYNQYTPNDLTVSFNENIRGYNYDMFTGVKYKVDISKPVGQRITNLTYSDGSELQDNDLIYLGVNNYRANTTLLNKSTGLFANETAEVFYDSSYDKISTIREMISEYIKAQPNSTITNTVDNNWEIIGQSWDYNLHQIARKLINSDTLTIPRSTDGRTPNVKAITKEDVLNATEQVDINAINDFHGNIMENGKTVGAGKLVSYLKEQKEINPNTIFVSAGDNYQGSAISNLSKGQIVEDIFEEVGIDLSVAGNHEFDWGIDLFNDWDKTSFIAANIVEKANNQSPSWIKPYEIKTVNGFNVGIIGIATPDTVFSTSPENVANLNFLDPIETTKKWEKHIRENHEVDAVIVLSHLGSYADGTGEAINLAKNVPSLDGVFSAHTHQYVDLDIEGVPVLQAGYAGRGVSKLRFIRDKITGELIGSYGEITHLYELPNLTSDQNTNNIIASYQDNLGPLLQEKVTYAPEDLSHTFEQDVQVTPMGQFIAKKMAEIGGTDIAVVNGGGIRGGLTAGDVTVETMYSLFPFDNTIVTLELSGAELQKIIQHGIYPDGFRPGQFYGLNVWINNQTRSTGTISSIRLLNGEPLDPERMYKITTIDFLVSGGDRYDFSQARNINDTFIPLREALIEELKKNDTIEFKFTNPLNFGADQTIYPLLTAPIFENVFDTSTQITGSGTNDSVITITNTKNQLVGTGIVKDSKFIIDVNKDIKLVANESLNVTTKLNDQEITSTLIVLSSNSTDNSNSESYQNSEYLEMGQFNELYTIISFIILLLMSKKLYYK